MMPQTDEGADTLFSQVFSDRAPDPPRKEPSPPKEDQVRGGKGYCFQRKKRMICPVLLLDSSTSLSLSPTQPFVISDRELNKYLRAGKHQEDAPEEKDEKKGIVFGDAGSSWRMMRLRNVERQAKEEGVPVEEVGMARFGSLEAFRDALKERSHLSSRSSSSGSGEREGARRSGRYAEGRKRRWADSGSSSSSSSSGASLSSHSSIDRSGPHGSMESSRTQSPSLSSTFSSGSSTPRSKFARPESSHPPQGHTTFVSSGSLVPQSLKTGTLDHPVDNNLPSHTSPPLTPAPTSRSAKEDPIMSQADLNRLRARILKASMQGKDVSSLEKEYKKESARAKSGPSSSSPQEAPSPSSTATAIHMSSYLAGHGEDFDAPRGHVRDDSLSKHSGTRAEVRVMCLEQTG